MSNDNETMISNWTDDEIAAFDEWRDWRTFADAFEGTVDPWATEVDLTPPF